MLTLDEALADVRRACTAWSEADRHEATCRPGCTACCRHLVPITPAEARRLRRVIAQLPDARRRRVLDRFEAARRQLQEAGLWDLLVELVGGHDTTPADGRAWLARAYVEHYVDCPFLDGDLCGIYDERPLACRLQAVSSRPEECHRPGGRVIPIHPPGRPPVRALAELEASDWLPLVCLLEGTLPASDEMAELETWVTRLRARTVTDER